MDMNDFSELDKWDHRRLFSIKGNRIFLKGNGSDGYLHITKTDGSFYIRYSERHDTARINQIPIEIKSNEIVIYKHDAEDRRKIEEAAEKASL